MWGNRADVDVWEVRVGLYGRQRRVFPCRAERRLQERSRVVVGYLPPSGTNTRETLSWINVMNRNTNYCVTSPPQAKPRVTEGYMEFLFMAMAQGEIQESC